MQKHIGNYGKTRDVYAEYNATRQEMKNLLNAKTNVDRLLRYSEQEQKHEERKGK